MKKYNLFTFRKARKDEIEKCVFACTRRDFMKNGFAKPFFNSYMRRKSQLAPTLFPTF